MASGTERYSDIETGNQLADSGTNSGTGGMTNSRSGELASYSGAFFQEGRRVD